MGVEFIPSKDLADKQGAGKVQPEKVCGYLKKKNRKHGILGSKWNKRWFVLENGILTYAKNKQEIVKGEIQVFSIHELEYVSQKKERLEFELKFPERVLHLQASCKDDVRKWIDAFENSKRTGSIRAQQHSPTSPLDVDCSDLPGYRARSQTSRDCKSAGATSTKKDVSPRSLLANPSNGRRCFGNYFDDFEADISSGYPSEPKVLERNQDTCVEEFSLGLSESPVKAIEDDQEEQENFGFKPFSTLNLDEKSDDGWLEDDWDNEDDSSKEHNSRRFGFQDQNSAPSDKAVHAEHSITPVVLLSPLGSSTSKSGSINSKDGLIQCDLKAVKYDSQITLPDIDTADVDSELDVCTIQAAKSNLLDDCAADDNWLEEEWDSD